jgi:hypothetical protein
MASRSGTRSRKRSSKVPRRKKPAARGRATRKVMNGLRETIMDGLPYILARAGDDAVDLVRSGRARRGIYFTAREQMSRHVIQAMVRHCDGDGRLASRVLGVSYSTVKAFNRVSDRDRD